VRGRSGRALCIWRTGVHRRAIHWAGIGPTWAMRAEPELLRNLYDLRAARGLI